MNVYQAIERSPVVLPKSYFDGKELLDSVKDSKGIMKESLYKVNDNYYIVTEFGFASWTDKVTAFCNISID